MSRIKKKKKLLKQNKKEIKKVYTILLINININQLTIKMKI